MRCKLQPVRLKQPREARSPRGHSCKHVRPNSEITYRTNSSGRIDSIAEADRPSEDRTSAPPPADELASARRFFSAASILRFSSAGRSIKWAGRPSSSELELSSDIFARVSGGGCASSSLPELIRGCPRAVRGGAVGPLSCTSMMGLSRLSPGVTGARMARARRRRIRYTFTSKAVTDSRKRTRKTPPRRSQLKSLNTATHTTHELYPTRLRK